ncbi:MAG: DUF1786 family protein [Candidatus Heimdallarchaeota archaeon]
MRLLAIDVGAGTQDILLYDSYNEIGNAVKAVLPSQPKLLAAKVDKLTRLRKNIVVDGETMGGFPFARSIKKHLEAGFNVAMTPKAARTIRDNLDIVREMSIEIISDALVDKLEGEGYVRLRTGDLDLDALERAFAYFGISIGSVDGIAVAVQDHGEAPKGESERRFRFERLLRPGIEAGGRIEEFAFKTGQVLPEFTRMRAVARQITERGCDGLVMDTGPAVLFGALEDEILKTKEYVGILNFGNQHTLGGIIVKKRLMAIYEQHTGLMNGLKAKNDLLALADGELPNEEVFKSGGHGAFTQEPIGSGNIEIIAILGPQKHKMNFSPLERLHHAAPFGDQMMAGPAGLIAGAQKLL